MIRVPRKSTNKLQQVLDRYIKKKRDEFQNYSLIKNLCLKSTFEELLRISIGF